ATGDSIKFYYTSGCGNSLTKAAKLTNTALKEPAAATAVTITALQTNVCGARRYRYSAPNLPAATATAGAATGYVWDFVGSLQSTMTIDSGDLNSQRFTVTFTSNAASATGDSVRVYYTSDCGNSLRKTAKLSNTALVAPAAATAVTITPIQTNVCSIRKYRYSAPNLPAATTTAGAASGYVWDVIGSLASTMTIDSGDLYSQRFTVTFTSNAASAAGDSVRVFYTTAGCGNSARKAAKLSNTSLVAPAAATAVTITPIQTTVCSSRKYRYSAPSLPAATTTAGAANGYVWDFVGSLASTMTIDSGNVNSQAFTVTFTSNAAAANVDSVRVLYTTAGCGNSARKGAKLANTLLGAPAAPASITIVTKSDVCYARTYRYIAPAPLPGATTSAGAASGYLWSAPTGTVGSTGTIDSGDVTSRIITVTYTSNAAAGLDSIRLQYTSAGCGTSAPKAQKLSNVIKTGCVPPITKTTSRVPNSSPASMEVKVYPNPTTSQFNVQVKSTGTEEAVVRVLDVTGRFIKSVKVSSNSNVNLGSDLKAGAYMLEVRQGKEVKTVRVMKF
ncbi:MAG: T9SS type A sorting domain-containing protein, partial [Sphingobacteriales bacterium]|nr:T9SS type A sorting domain-containing protein [Sphingobacteriales bacterium]